MGSAGSVFATLSVKLESPVHPEFLPWPASLVLGRHFYSGVRTSVNVTIWNTSASDASDLTSLYLRTARPARTSAVRVFRRRVRAIT